MGWVWRDDDEADAVINSSDGYGNGIGNGERCSTSTVVRTQCKTEEVQPGKFIRKCEKTEETLRRCVGRPVEVLKSNKEYTEDDITDQVIKGSAPEGSFVSPFTFSGLRDGMESIEHGIESIERDFLGGINQFFRAAEEMKNSFFDAFGYDGQLSSSPPPMGRRVPAEGKPEIEAHPKAKQADYKSGDFDLSGLAKDI